MIRIKKNWNKIKIYTMYIKIYWYAYKRNQFIIQLLDVSVYSVTTPFHENFQFISNWFSQADTCICSLSTLILKFGLMKIAIQINLQEIAVGSMTQDTKQTYHLSFTCKTYKMTNFGNSIRSVNLWHSLNLNMSAPSVRQS